MKKVFKVNKGRISTEDPDIIKFLENSLIIQRKDEDFQSWRSNFKVTIILNVVKRYKKNARGGKNGRR